MRKVFDILICLSHNEKNQTTTTKNGVENLWKIARYGSSKDRTWRQHKLSYIEVRQQNSTSPQTDDVSENRTLGLGYSDNMWSGSSAWRAPPLLSDHTEEPGGLIVYAYASQTTLSWLQLSIEEATRSA